MYLEPALLVGTRPCHIRTIILPPGCQIRCRAAILAALVGMYRNLPYIRGLARNFIFFWGSPLKFRD
jgi:hypothetical protein